MAALTTQEKPKSTTEETKPETEQRTYENAWSPLVSDMENIANIQMNRVNAKAHSEIAMRTSAIDPRYLPARGIRLFSFIDFSLDRDA